MECIDAYNLFYAFDTVPIKCDAKVQTFCIQRDSVSYLLIIIKQFELDNCLGKSITKRPRGGGRTS